MLDMLREQFSQPSDDFSPIPFWFWNGVLEEGELIKQIHDFQSKGVMGFVIHPRLGLCESIPYLSERYMDFVEIAVKEARKRNMIVYLYDEAMYPSGSAMGKVVRESPEYASRGLRMIQIECAKTVEVPVRLEANERFVSAQAVCFADKDGQVMLERTILLKQQQAMISFTPPCEGNWHILLFVETPSKGVIRGVYYGQDDTDENAPPSADLLNKEATETFIRITHETYRERLQSYFGTTIKGFFTDEPNILGRNPLSDLIPWTNHFLEDLRHQGLDESHLPALWLEAGQHTNWIRNLYRKAINNKLAHNYYRPLSKWCEKYGLELTGHPSASDDIGLLQYFHLPGQDVVWRYVEPVKGKIVDGPDSTLAKCASDAARHRGRIRNVVECFGACGKDDIGWNFSADEMKWYMDWLFVRGVNMLMPHAFYYSIEGQRLHERPPDVGPRNIWWSHYTKISQYIKRMSWLMTGGINVTPIAILCQADRLPWEIAKPLYENQIEFNYLEESLWTTVAKIENDIISIEKQCYRILVVDDPSLLEQNTVKKLQQYINSGGKVIVYNDQGNTVLSGAINIPATSEIIHVLDRIVPRDVHLSPAHHMIRATHIYKEGVHFYLVVNEGEQRYEGKMKLGAAGAVEEWSPWEGSTTKKYAYAIGESEITLAFQLERRESVIFVVNPQEKPKLAPNLKNIPSLQKKMKLESWETTGFRNEEFESTLLSSWTDWQEGDQFSGTVEYRTHFTISKEQYEKTVSLDLGEVHEIVTVQLNGIDLGVKMWAPFQYEPLNHALKVGSNELRVKVSNSLANKYNGAKLTSGLLGPVMVRFGR